MEVLGLIKTTLLDYPGHIACTIFLGGCNFLCPFCHNNSLVQKEFFPQSIPIENIMNFLEKRKHTLEGVCITGGEPTIHNESLLTFINKIKTLGYKIKLDTNGSNPNLLKSLYQKKLIDYIAMDIKNNIESYNITCGVSNVNMNNILESVRWIKNSGIDYEFRTTVVKEFHTKEHIHSIGQWLYGSKRVFIQNFKHSNTQIKEGFHPLSKEQLQLYKSILKNYIENVEIRAL